MTVSAFSHLFVPSLFGCLVLLMAAQNTLGEALEHTTRRHMLLLILISYV
jgi:hypothetical protein